MPTSNPSETVETANAMLSIKDNNSSMPVTVALETAATFSAAIPLYLGDAFASRHVELSGDFAEGKRCLSRALTTMLCLFEAFRRHERTANSRHQ
jgi:hypothetical protein